MGEERRWDRQPTIAVAIGMRVGAEAWRMGLAQTTRALLVRTRAPRREYRWGGATRATKAALWWLKMVQLRAPGQATRKERARERERIRAMATATAMGSVRAHRSRALQQAKLEQGSARGEKKEREQERRAQAQQREREIQQETTYRQCRCRWKPLQRW
jgi:hypothetical protein